MESCKRIFHLVRVDGREEPFPENQGRFVEDRQILRNGTKAFPRTVNSSLLAQAQG
jgi:hypothetical protein